MSRIKIILLILIIAALAIVFVQNRQPIALKLLCAEQIQSCPYKTPPLPLALWIGLFALLGAIANLSVQTLNNSGYISSRRPKATIDDNLYPDSRNKQNKSRQDKYAVSADLSAENQFSDATSYEVRQEPQNVERSGSTYSYKYREVGDRLESNQDVSKKTSIDPEIKINQTKDQDDEDWI
jgi:hypothetical protein